MISRAFSVVLALTCLAATASPRYSFKDLGTLGGSHSNAVAINAMGQVTGYSWLPGDSGAIRATMWTGGSITDLGAASAGGSQASAINDAGWIAGGTSVQGNGSWSPALWSAQTGWVLLPTPVGATGHVFGLNSNGLGVGVSGNTATVWANGEARVIGPNDGRASYAKSVSASGVIVGAVADVPQYPLLVGTSQPAAWLEGGLHMLPLPPSARGGAAEAVNNNQLAVGTVYWRDSSEAPALWSLASMELTMLPSFGGLYGRATGLNNQGEVVGYATRGNSDQRAVLWSNLVMSDLNDLVDDTGAGWLLQAANAINDRGEIVGIALNAFGQQHAYLLTPILAVPEIPMSVLLLAGLPFVVVRLRQARVS